MDNEIEFKECTLHDKAWIDGILAQADRRGCEYSFSCMYMWAPVYALRVAQAAGCLMVQSLHRDPPGYLFPAGGMDKLRGAVQALMGHCKAGGYPLRFYSVAADQREWLEEWFPGAFQFRPAPDTAEYLYDAQSLITLAGKKLHAKRNHINRFIAEHPDWSFERMTDANLEECRDLQRLWLQQRLENAQESGSTNEGFLHEATAVDLAFTHFHALGLRGGALRAGGRIVAYAMGEMLGSDTFDIRIEKALAQMQGAYALINREFARAFCQDAVYINREDDAGSPGLRKAKLSYQPALMLEKFTAIKTDAG